MFVCSTGFARFVDLESVIPEGHFDENPKETTGKKTLDKEDAIQEQIRRDEALARSMSYDYRTPCKSTHSSDCRRFIYLVLHYCCFSTECTIRMG